MTWLDVQQRLGELEEQIYSLPMIVDFVNNEENFDNEKQTLFIMQFHSFNSVKRKIEQLPKSMDEIRNNILKYGNDLQMVCEYLKKVEKDFDDLNKGVEILKVLVSLNGKEYEFKDGYENSFSFHSHMSLLKKIIEIYENDDMSAEEKYKYSDVYDSTLTKEEKGELHIQGFIGTPDKSILNKATAPLYFNEMRRGNAIKRMEKIQRVFMETGAYCEEVLQNMSLEQLIENYGCILESNYVKTMQDQKKQ